LTGDAAARIGRAALVRVLAEHTYAHRALEVERVLHGLSPTEVAA
jgi:spore maturation protein CgeB